MAKCILTALACACLTACGGGSGATTAAPTSPQPTGCTPQVVTVALLGDSTQQGVDGAAGGLAVHNPGAELQADMDAEFGVGAVVVTDYGVSSTVSSQAPKVSADVIVANYGINDMREPGMTPAGFASNMRATGATLIETQLPILDRSWPEASYVSAAEGLGLPVADVNAYVLALPNWQAHFAGEWSQGVHPDDALYVLIVDNVLAPAVAKQVAPLRCVKS